MQLENGEKEPQSRPQKIRGDRAEPSSVQAHEAGEGQDCEEEARQINPPAERMIAVETLCSI